MMARTQSRTCMPANELAFGFRCTRRTSFLALSMTRLAEGLGPITSLALDVVVAIVCKSRMEWIRRTLVIDVSSHRSPRCGPFWSARVLPNTCDHFECGVINLRHHRAYEASSQYSRKPKCGVVPRKKQHGHVSAIVSIIII